MDVFQYNTALDDDTIDNLVGDPVTVELIKLMNWTSYTKEEMDEVLLGNDRFLELLLRLGMVVKERDLYSLDVSLQSFGHPLKSAMDIAEILSFTWMWISKIGDIATNVARTMVEILFFVPTDWDYETDALALRAGLIDGNCNLTRDGRRRALEIFAQLLIIFDSHLWI